MTDIESDASIILEFEDDDSESISNTDATSDGKATHLDSAFNKTSPLNIETDDSEFDIDESQFSEDDLEDNYLVFPVKKTTKDLLNEDSVPSLKYECLTTQEIFENMLKRVHHLQPVFSLPPQDILILMQRHDWNEERLLEEWTEKMDNLLVESGLNTSGGSDGRGLKNGKEFFCPICCEDNLTETFSLECGHEYCIGCYRHYIKDRINHGNIISCMDCSLALKNGDIDQVMGGASSAKLMDSSIKSFIRKHSNNYKWCPYTDCKCIIHLRDTLSLQEYSRLHASRFVTCNMAHSFCFGCGFEIHAPADCRVTDQWVKKARLECENLNWVLSHTKECPQCSVNIEKNGGCNHMVCSSCRHEFCWICGGDWAPHGSSFYQCAMYKNEDKNKLVADTPKKALRRYAFFYKMFTEHEVSAKLDWKLGETVGFKVKGLQEKIGVSWIEGQFLAESLKTLNEGRTALKWSFAVAYYSDPSHNLTKIFIDNQGLLSNAVESLSELLQIKSPEVIMKRRTEFYNKAGYVKNRTRALLECGRDLLRKGISKATE